MHRTAAVGASLLLLALMAALDPVPVESGSSPARSPEEALAQHFERTGAGYAGDCAQTRSPDDIGKICSTFVAQRGDLFAYLTGRTFSEYGLWVFLRRDSDGWRVMTVASLDFFAVPLLVPWPG